MFEKLFGKKKQRKIFIYSGAGISKESGHSMWSFNKEKTCLASESIQEIINEECN
jgi:NAD-dependent SIR2 family protein deacetylase